MKFARFAALGVAVLLSATGAGIAQPETALLTVSGDGRVSVEPDLVTITLGVLAENTAAAQAVAEMSTDMAALLDNLVAAGVASEDIQTSGLSVAPRWSDSSYDKGRPRQIEAFVASSEVTVQLPDIDRLGPLLDVVVRGGVNQFHGLQFGLQSPRATQDAAREAAVADAIRKAELLARAAGVSLGRIVSIDEQGSARPFMVRAEMGAAASAGGVPVAAGEIDLTASVSLVYEILSPEVGPDFAD